MKLKKKLQQKNANDDELFYSRFYLQSLAFFRH